MKTQQKINKISSVLPVLGLAILLLLSPCKIRNFIQSELGIPQTNVSNKSKSTISKSECLTIDQSDFVNNLTKPKTLVKYFIYPNVDEVCFLFDKEPEAKNPYHPQIWHQIDTVPYYILYQNFKVFS